MSIAPTINGSPEERFVALLSGDQGVADEEQVVKDLLARGGFEIADLSKERVMGSRVISEDDTEPYLTNPASGYKVVDRFGTTEPSSWLEWFWSRAASLIHNNKREEAVVFLREQLEKCRPLAPIIVNAYGDIFREAYREAGVSRCTDASIIKNVGHAFCNNYVDLKVISPSHRVLLCKGCMLRLPIPNEVETWGQLRAHFAQFNS